MSPPRVCSPPLIYMPAHHYDFPFNSKPSDLNPKTSKTPTPASLEELIIAKEDTLVGRSNYHQECPIQKPDCSSSMKTLQCCLLRTIPFFTLPYVNRDRCVVWLANAGEQAIIKHKTVFMLRSEFESNNLFVWDYCYLLKKS